MKSFVISLIDAEARRKHIEHEFHVKNIEFSFFNAININQVAEFSEKLKVKLGNSNLTDGEKACLLSHVFLWNKAVEEELPYVAIYEDDIHLGENIESLFRDDSWIHSEIDIVKLEVFSKATLMDFRKIYVSKERGLRKLRGEHLGAAGYILNLKSAKILLKYIQSLDEVIPVDHVLFEVFVVRKYLNIYQMTPGTCIQSDRRETFESVNKIQSQLETERRLRLDVNAMNHKKIKRDLTFKLKRELRRFIVKFGLIFGRINFK